MEIHNPSNKTPHDASRRAFLATLTNVTAVGLGMHLIGCFTEDPASSTIAAAPDGKGNCGLAKTATDRTGTISFNHGHVAVVTTAQQDAGMAFNLDIEGSANHPHTVQLTEQDVADLKAGLQVSKTSSNNSGHTHTVTFAAATSIWKPNC